MYYEDMFAVILHISCLIFNYYFYLCGLKPQALKFATEFKQHFGVTQACVRGHEVDLSV